MKKLLLILSIILSTATYSNGQVRPADSAPVIRYFPNPAITSVTFDFQSNYESGFNLQIFSFLGRKMYENNNLAPRTTINLNDYIRGVYIYQLRDKSGRMIESGKFQVSK